MKPINTNAWFKRCEDFGRKIRMCRKQRKLPQKAFCCLLGVCERKLRELERGLYLSPQTIVTIQRFLKSSESDRAPLCNPYLPLSRDEIRKLELDELVIAIFGDADSQPISALAPSSTPCMTIGNCKINFKLLAGSLESSSAPALKVKAEWVADPFIPSEDVISFLWQQVSEVQNRAARNGRRLIFRRLGRFLSYRHTGNNICLQLQPTDYATFAATNLNICDSRGEISEYGRKLLKLSGTTLSMGQRYLANPLNTILTIVTKDKKTFIPVRSKKVFERPLTWQASVGGAVEEHEQPHQTVVRETKEELGIEIDPESVTFHALGINQFSGEPDLITSIETSLDSREVDEAFRRKAQRFEFHKYTTWTLTARNLRKIVAEFNCRVWSQPSDQAAVIFTLIREFGFHAVDRAFAQSNPGINADEQRCYFNFTA